MADWQNKKITVLGLGRSGVSTACYLAKRGASVTLSEGKELSEDKKTQAEDLKKQGIKVESGGHSDEAIDKADLIITSPGIPPSSDVIKRAREKGREVICDVELAYRETEVPIIAITGTNGKSTTVALISFILTKSGFKAPACGNFGVPILDQLALDPDYLVVETSSYQLEYCSQLAPKVAVWMNLTPDHIDWHEGVENYIAAKHKLFANQTAKQFAVLNMADSTVAAVPTKARIIPFSATATLDHCVNATFVKYDHFAYRYDMKARVLCRTNELSIIGKHNYENVLAAICVAAILEIDPDKLETYLKEFKALEHRLEFVATMNGVPYFNDSKATNTDSTIKALESFPEKKIVLIAGGRDKGTELNEFVGAVRKYSAAVILIGEAKERFENALREGGFDCIYIAENMEEAVDIGAELKAGPVVLSPACASFDMFKDFEDRGRVFKDIVRAKLAKVAT